MKKTYICPQTDIFEMPAYGVMKQYWSMKEGRTDEIPPDPDDVEPEYGEQGAKGGAFDDWLGSPAVRQSQKQDFDLNNIWDPASIWED